MEHYYYLRTKIVTVHVITYAVHDGSSSSRRTLFQSSWLLHRSVASTSTSRLEGRALPHSPHLGWPHFPQGPGTFPLLRRLHSPCLDLGKWPPGDLPRHMPHFFAGGPSSFLLLGPCPPRLDTRLLGCCAGREGISLALLALLDFLSRLGHWAPVGLDLPVYHPR